MQETKKIFLFIIVVLYQFIAAAQCNTTIKNIPLSLKIVALCEKITNTNNDPLLIMKCFFTDSVIAEKLSYYTPYFERDSLYTFNTSVFQNLTLSRLYNAVDKSKYLYEIYFKLNSVYQLSNSKKNIEYDTANKTNISYEELNTYLGKSIALYPPNFQPADRKRYSYVYTNPITYGKAIVAITSFNAPGNSYNFIDDIIISNESVGIMPDPTPLKLNKDYLQKHKTKKN